MIASQHIRHEAFLSKKLYSVCWTNLSITKLTIILLHNRAYNSKILKSKFKSNIVINSSLLRDYSKHLCEHCIVQKILNVQDVFLYNNSHFIQRLTNSHESISEKKYFPVILTKPYDYDFFVKKTLFLKQIHVTQNKLSTTLLKEDQLGSIFNILSNSVHPFHIYDENVIFENNILNTVTVGLPKYSKQLSTLRILGHLKFLKVKMEVLKISKHTEDGTIKIRWRIKGLSLWKLLVSKLNLSNTSWDNIEVWYDGFSTLYVNNQGFVVKHTVDKMIPDNDRLLPSSHALQLNLPK